MTRIPAPPAFWLAACAGLCLALVAALSPPGASMVADLPPVVQIDL